MPGAPGQETVGVDAGRSGQPTAVREERPLVDVLDGVLVMREPRPGAGNVAIDASGEQDRPRVDGVPAEAVERYDAPYGVANDAE